MNSKQLRNLWNNIIQKCTNPKHHAYKYFGAKGINIDNDWLKSYYRFVSDIGIPNIDSTLVRINKKGHFTPLNVQWVPKKKKPKIIKKSNNKLHPSTIQSRINSGWKPSIAYSKPPRQKKNINNFSLEFTTNNQQKMILSNSTISKCNQALNDIIIESLNRNNKNPISLLIKQNETPIISISLEYPK